METSWIFPCRVPDNNNICNYCMSRILRQLSDTSDRRHMCFLTFPLEAQSNPYRFWNDYINYCDIFIRHTNLNIFTEFISIFAEFLIISLCNGLPMSSAIHKLAFVKYCKPFCILIISHQDIRVYILHWFGF